MASARDALIVRVLVRLSSCLLLLCFLPALATAEQGGITLGGNQDSVVLTLDLKTGDWVDYSWSASVSLDFRVENAGGTNTFVDRSGQVGSGAFQAPTDGSYRFEFRNQNNEAAGGQWAITKRAESPVMLVLLAAVLAVAAIAFLVLRRRGKHGAPPETPPKTP